jgi:hypothetical protein
MIRRMSTLIVVALIATILIPGVPTAYAQDMPTHAHVTIDVKPGSYPNAININIKSKSTVPVAVLGSASFDVNDVLADTVRFGPMHDPGGMHQHNAGATALRYAPEDVNADGHMDLVFHFTAAETGLDAEDTQACLHGTLVADGQHFCGHDSVKVKVKVIE